MKITFAYLVVILNLLGAEAAQDFKVQLQKGKVSVSASQKTEAVRQKRRQLKKNAKKMSDSDELKTMSNNDIQHEKEEKVANLGLHKESLQKRALDWMNPLKAGSPNSSERRMGHMSMTDKRQASGNHGNYDLFENAQNHFKSAELKKNNGVPKVGGDTYVDITNYMNLQYTGPVIMGSSQKVLDVIYDTGSDWLVLDTDFCENCHDPVYDTTTSSDYQRVSRQKMTQEYGSASIVGYNATDRISVGGDTRLDAFPWFALTEQIGIEESFDGILGFSRQNTDYWWDHGPLLLEQLKTFDQISEEQVSFLLADTKYNSFCDYGAYDVSMIKDQDEDQITWVDMPKAEFFWESDKVQGMKIGTSDKYRQMTAEYSYAGYEYPAIYDTGTSLVYAPAGLGYELLTRLTKGLDKYYDRDSGFMYVSCQQKRYYEDVFLTIDGYKFQIRVDDYWYQFDSDYQGGQDVCLLGFIDDEYADYWLLGDVFLRGYYTIHDNTDHDNARIGFAPHWVSDKVKVVDTTVTDTSVDDVLYECTPVYSYWPGSYSTGQAQYWGNIWANVFGC